jgi:hypothetical protein
VGLRAKTNTVHIAELWTDQEKDSFDVPYSIRRQYCRVDLSPQHKEGKPKILNFKDYNGDGRPLEIAFCDAQNCSILKTSLIGYSVQDDRVIR